MSSLHFQTFASSSKGCAYLLSGGGASNPLLIDCGLPFAKLQQMLGFSTSSLAACLISHGHGDHCRCAASLMAHGIDCYAHPDAWAGINRFAGNTVYSGRRAKSIYMDCEPVQIGDWTVIPFDTVHDSPGSLGFVIESPQGGRLLYLTDSVYSKFRFEGLTHLAVECNHSVEILRKNLECGAIDKERFDRTIRTHLSLERLLKMLCCNDLSKVEEIHLLHLSDLNSDAEGFKKAVQRLTGVATYIAGEKVPA